MSPFLGACTYPTQHQCLQSAEWLIEVNQLCDVEIGLAEIEECHTVSKASRVANSYYLRSIAGRSGLVNGLESSLKHTEGDFLWVSGNWEYGAEQRFFRPQGLRAATL